MTYFIEGHEKKKKKKKKKLVGVDDPLPSIIGRENS